MGRPPRFDENGNYLLPSERQEIAGEDDSSGGGPYRGVFRPIYQPDAIEQMDEIRRAHPGAIDSLSHKAALQQQQRAQENARAPYSRICPPSFGTNGTIGNQTLDLVAGQTTQVAQWAADGDVESATIGVTVAPVTPPQPAQVIHGFPTALMYRPYGILQIGTRNVTTQVRFDIGTGIAFNVGAAYVALLVGLDPVNAAFPNSAPPVKFSGWLSSLPLPSPRPPTVTTYIDSLGIGASTGPLPRPAFAVDVLPIQMSSLTGSCTIQFIDAGGFSVTQLAIPAPGAQVAPIPWPGDAVAFNVQNTAAGAQTIRVIHSLGL